MTTATMPLTVLLIVKREEELSDI